MRTTANRARLERGGRPTAKIGSPAAALLSGIAVKDVRAAKPTCPRAKAVAARDVAARQPVVPS